MDREKTIYDSKLYIEDLHTAAQHTLGIEKLRGMSVLVTGASGTIGSFIVDELCEYGEIHVIACGRNTAKLEKRFSRFAGAGCLKFCSLDILDDSSFDKLPDEHVDYIIHAAGNAFPSAFIDHSDETVRGNICGTARLLEYGRSHGCQKFVYVSSGEVYSLDEEDRKSWADKWKRSITGVDSEDALRDDYLDDQVLGPDSKSVAGLSSHVQRYMQLVQNEVTRRGPRSCYPVSKSAAEAMCLSHINIVVVRPCHTFGPGITGSDDRAHVQFAKKAVAGEDIVLNSAGTQLRSYNYVADAASGIVSAMLSGELGAMRDKEFESHNRVFDICSRENEITIKGLAELIAETAGVSVSVKEADSREKSLQSPINKQILDPADLERIGWKKAFDLKTGVEHFVEIINMY
ncbi:NAD-dependent epimerase/dehydratase family protein [Butyrivibrio sp. XBB1001]|uniref:NAD-dependent epimerase/dehydratase family protein n=1 Tax=Butyrivibrio sp. XBB1001 TaxID=1280682 RepID=UPI00047AE26C|nr:NAD(P)-dependent oxidoreductase [Butyrivibrio sp. XBB1001]